MAAAKGPITGVECCKAGPEGAVAGMMPEDIMLPGCKQLCLLMPTAARCMQQETLKQESDRDYTRSCDKRYCCTQYTVLNGKYRNKHSEQSMLEHRQALPDYVSTKEVPLQQEIVHEGHEEQQRCKAAGNEGHKVGHLGQPRGGELLQVLLCCLVTGV